MLLRAVPAFSAGVRAQKRAADPRCYNGYAHRTLPVHCQAPTERFCISPARQAVSAAALLASSSLLFAPTPVNALEITYANPEVKAKMEERDDAMDFKCKGGMFDCDGDRREFAKKQYAGFVSRLDGSAEDGEDVEEQQGTATVAPELNRSSP